MTDYRSTNGQFAVHYAHTSPSGRPPAPRSTSRSDIGPDNMGPRSPQQGRNTGSTNIGSSIWNFVVGDPNSEYPDDEAYRGYSYFVPRDNAAGAPSSGQEGRGQRGTAYMDNASGSYLEAGSSGMVPAYRPGFPDDGQSEISDYDFYVDEETGDTLIGGPNSIEHGPQAPERAAGGQPSYIHLQQIPPTGGQAYRSPGAVTSMHDEIGWDRGANGSQAYSSPTSTHSPGFKRKGEAHAHFDAPPTEENEPYPTHDGFDQAPIPYGSNDMQQIPKSGSLRRGNAREKERNRSQNLPKALNNPKVREQLAKLKQHRPYFMYAATLVQFAMVILSFAVNKDMTGEFIQTQPSFNYMIGPASGPLIRMGARFVPCIRTVPTYTSNASTTYLPYCPVGVTAPCKLSDVCGFSGKPDQWYRFIVPIFLHGGIVHFIFNAAFQLRTGVAMERDFGAWRIGIIYMASGIAGFVFGGNFTVLSVSVGSSGALYGLLACLVLDLLQNWSLIQRPWLELFKMSIVVIISLGIGLLPYIDNFAHLGGFFTGIFTGLIFMPTITFGKWDKRRKRILMVLAIPSIIVIFVLLFLFFYNGTASQCSWCKYLDCIPVMGWCDDLTY
ncbi:hypothetical protein HDU93_003966 [Gonapodya sp. JEL0774]|nr:hypothetical protein HDU93_003966 [Gonapodya sp. JEL0774]